MINIDSKIFIAGHKGMLGSSILRTLKKKGYKNLITVEKKSLDLRNQALVKKFFKTKKLDAVIIAAAKVGGIKANINFPANFINDNLQIQTNLILSSHEYNVKKLILFGSSCIYPKDLKKPIKENQMLIGPLEKTNESYFVRGEGMITSLEDIENIVIKNIEGIPILIKDVADHLPPKVLLNGRGFPYHFLALFPLKPPPWCSA